MTEITMAAHQLANDIRWERKMTRESLVETAIAIAFAGLNWLLAPWPGVKFVMTAVLLITALAMFSSFLQHLQRWNELKEM